jgi:GT2 family glycosyltransferase
MSILCMAVFDTEENKRTEYTEKTLECLYETVDLNKHRIFVIDNNSCELTKLILKGYQTREYITLITLPENIGTARAINKAWKFRVPGEHAIKLDNDVIVNQSGWVEAMEEAIQRDPTIGIVGLKRKDLAEYPGNPIEWYDSKLYFLPHEPGQSWIPFEEVVHVMGTCQMYSDALLNKIGYLVQPGLYGFDDSLASIRARLAGFKVGFLPHIQISHIDVNENPYWLEKQILAGKDMQKYNELREKYYRKEIPLYWEDPE